MKVLFVHNPGSGDDDHAREHLLELMDRAGHEVTYEASKGEWRALLDHDIELIAVAGGDGTVSEVAKATVQSGIPVAILPTGTANNIARWLGLTGTTHADLIGDWTNALRAPFDLGIVHGPWGTFRFLESVGVGVFCDLISEIDSGASGYVNELDGRSARVAAALDVLDQVLSRSHPVACDIRLDNETMSGEYLLIEILNFGSAGPNLRLAPRADGADGRLDVVLVRADERQSFEEQLTAMRNDPSRRAELRVHHARNVTVRAAGSMVHLDDTLWVADNGPTWITAHASVQPGAVTFLVPACATTTTRS